MRRILVSGLTFLASPMFAEFMLNSNSVDTSLFRVTTFATGITSPFMMQRLSDGSIAVAGFGGIVRFTDVNGDGIADGPATSIFSDGNGLGIGFQRAGKYLVYSDVNNASITLLEPGATAADPLTPVAQLNLNYPANWLHPTAGIAVRPTPGSPGSYDLVFNVGSEFNAQLSSQTVGLSGLFTADLQADSLYMLTIDQTGALPVASNLRQVATGIRNVTGMGFHPVTGDFIFADNAIDGATPQAEPPQADELNRIAAAVFGTSTPDFGYPNCYIEYRTGAQIGSGCTGALAVFQPLNNGTPLGSESEGPASIAFSPSAFPSAFGNGVFIGFSGKFGVIGPGNEENAVVYYDFGTGQYIHFVENSLEGVGQPIGLLSTADSLFIADFATGSVYQISAVPEPSTTFLCAAALAAAVFSRRRFR